jgi:hypothetical protein
MLLRPWSEGGGGGGWGGLEDTGQIHAYIANLKSTLIFKTFATGLALKVGDGMGGQRKE